MSLSDAHMHLFRHGYRRPGLPPLFGDHEVEAYEALRAAHGIGLALGIGYQADGIDPDNNAYLLSLRPQRPWLSSLAHVAPDAPPSPLHIDGLLKAGHSGIAIYAPGPREAALVMDWPARWWETLHDRNALVSINAPPEAIAVIARHLPVYPAVQYLFSHLGLPGIITPETQPEALQRRLRPLLGLAAMPNVHVKISGLYATSDPPHLFPHTTARTAVQSIINAFGPSRCLWASDFAPALDFVSFPQTVAWPGSENLSRVDRQLICRDNLVRLVSSVRLA